MAHLCVLVSLLAALCLGASTGATISYFDIVANMSLYDNTTTTFTDALANVIYVDPATIFVVSAVQLSANEENTFDTICTGLLPNATSSSSSSMLFTGNETNSTNTTSSLVRMNMTFIGNLTEAAASSVALESISVFAACEIGLLSINVTNITVNASASVVLVVTLVDGVTPQQFVANLSALLHVPMSVFTITRSGNTTMAASEEVATAARTYWTAGMGETFNLTIVGANTGVIQDRILSLTPLELLSLGAQDLTPASPATSAPSNTPATSTTAPTSAPTANDGDDGDDTKLIIILCCSIGGGVLLIIIVVVCVVRKRNSQRKALHRDDSNNCLVRPATQQATEMRQEDVTTGNHAQVIIGSDSRGAEDVYGYPQSRGTNANGARSPTMRVPSQRRIPLEHSNADLL